MIKEIAWDVFKNTGDINTFLEYKKIEDLEKRILEVQDIQENININSQNIDKNITQL